MNPIAFINETLTALHMPEIGVTELLDIGMLCALIYYVLRWIRQTHAWALLKGIVIVVLVALAAFLFDLVIVIWVVQNTLAMGLIALVILFQPELRKALEQLGRGVPGLTTAERGRGVSANVIDEISHAVAAMSSRKIGALICIEREVTLADIGQTGIPIDALVTRQIVMNIFAPNSPLHDGAIVIRGSRVTAAACMLPLTSEDIDASHELGMRHRAAVGLSEVSDAFVVVVSEETGSISAVQAGKLNRHLSEKELRNMLTAEISDESKRRLMPWKSRKI